MCRFRFLREGIDFWSEEQFREEGSIKRVGTSENDYHLYKCQLLLTSVHQKQTTHDLNSNAKLSKPMPVFQNKEAKAQRRAQTK